MRQAIQTRYIGPTNFRGSRVKAYAEAGATTISFDDDYFTVEEKKVYGDGADGWISRAHTRAAYAFACKFGWVGVWVAGASPDKRGCVFVHVSRSTTVPPGLENVAFVVAEGAKP